VYGISFDQLYTITNMPLGRFARQLEAQGILDAYMVLLKQNANTANLTAMMCRDTLNVDWQGKLYDCDFNQALVLPAALADNYIGQIRLEDVINLPVQTGDHCFGCTAGAGSSCRGSLLSQTA
jgi:radical SAM/Cys-rich protein